MQVELSEQDINAICFAYTKLQMEHILNPHIEAKPKQHLMTAIKQLGCLIDRIETQQKDGRLPRKDKDKQEEQT